MTTFLPANSAAGSTSAPPSGVACLMVTEGIFWPLVIMAIPYHRASPPADRHLQADRGRSGVRVCGRPGIGAAAGPTCEREPRGAAGPGAAQLDGACRRFGRRG